MSFLVSSMTVPRRNLSMNGTVKLVNNRSVLENHSVPGHSSALVIDCQPEAAGRILGVLLTASEEIIGLPPAECSPLYTRCS